MSRDGDGDIDGDGDDSQGGDGVKGLSNSLVVNRRS